MKTDDLSNQNLIHKYRCLLRHSMWVVCWGLARLPVAALWTSSCAVPSCHDVFAWSHQVFSWWWTAEQRHTSVKRNLLWTKAANETNCTYWYGLWVIQMVSQEEEHVWYKLRNIVWVGIDEGTES